MSARVSEVCLDVNDLPMMSAFWSAALEVPAQGSDDPDEQVVELVLSPQLSLLLLTVPERKTVKDRLHLDLSPRGCDQDEEVARLEALGARRVDVGQGSPSWVVLTDPEGNEFCVLRTRRDDPAG